MCGLTVSGYSSATEALEREGWRLSEMGQASGWGRVHSYVFANRKRNLCTVKTACVPALEEADAWNITLTYDPYDTAPVYIWYIRGEWTLQISAANCSAASMLPDRDLGSGGLSLILPGETHEAKSTFSLIYFYW